MKNIIENMIADSFSFLITQFDFFHVKMKSDRYEAKTRFVNKYCAITITYEYRDAYFNVVISKLVDGNIIPSPSSFLIHKGTILYNHSLNDILELLSPDDVMLPIYEYGEDSPYHDEKNGFEKYIAKYADNLKKYGPPFFKGDFSLFPLLDEIVVARIEEWNKRWN